MNSLTHWTKERAHSVPLPTRLHRSRSRRVATVMDRLKSQSKRTDAFEKRQVMARAKGQQDPKRLQFLMPRVEIIDDINESRLVVKVEIPDIDPNDVHLKLRGTLLSVYGERLPDLAAVSEQYRDGLRFHSQTSGRYSPNIILLGSGRVASCPPSQVIPNQVNSAVTQQSEQSHPSTPSAGRIRAERVHYNELRYGAFCRNLRVPPGTKASDIEGTFRNGMLLLSWPRLLNPTQTENAEAPSNESVAVTITNATPSPIAVKVESCDAMEVESHQ